MAAVDRRLGMIRRGTTPAAPKPINLPSQKLENQGLVPDVEIVPRGTCCWGRAGRFPSASGKNIERTDSTPLLSENNGVVENGMNVQNDLVSIDEVQGLAERSKPAHLVESSTLPTSSPGCTAAVETASALSSLGANDAKLDRSPASSDAGSLPGSVAQVSCMESGTSPLVTPVASNNLCGSAAKVEEQKHSKGSSVVCEGSENVSNLESQQGTCGGNESLPRCQDFGYFEGLYNNHHPFFSPGMSYSNGSGMAFGPGMHPELSQHDGFYSFLGVPYYDSTKDKEIVVITMVRNPGYHGNYFPHPSLPDQFGRPTVCGNFPLQFGHFDNFAMPGQDILHGGHHMSAEMNSMCSAEQDEFVCYEQGYYEDAWLNGSSIGDVQRGSGAFLGTSFPMNKNVPKRGGRQKSTYRNKRAAPKEALSAASKPERRVTLLTKVSQHEVIISSLQKRSKPAGNGLAGGFSSAPSFMEKFMEAPLRDRQCETALTESSSANRIHEIVDNEKVDVSGVSRNLSAQEVILQQATCIGSSNVVSDLSSSHDVSCLQSKAGTSDSEPSSTTISTSASHAHGEIVECHEDIMNKDRSTCEAKHVNSHANGCTMNAAEVPQDVPLSDSTESAALIEQENEYVSREETLCTTTVALLPYKHNQGSLSGVSNQKSNMKWRRKGAAAMAKLGQENLNSMVQEAVVDNQLASLASISDKTIASANSLANATDITNAMPHWDISLSSCVTASLSGGEGSVVSNEKLDAVGSLNCAGPDSVSNIRKSRKIHKTISGNVDLHNVADSGVVQTPESSNKLAIKTLSFAEGRDLNSKSTSCGIGKKWRPKLPGAGHGKSATKAFSQQASKATLVSEPQESNPSLTNIDRDLKHRLEVSWDDKCVDKVKQQDQYEGCDAFLFSPMVDTKQIAKVMSLTHVTGKNSNCMAQREQNVEFCFSETVPLTYSRAEHRKYVEKGIKKQKPLQQEPLASKPEGSSSACQWDMCLNNDSFEACGGPNSSENHSGEASKVSRTSKFPSTTQGSQPMSVVQAQEKSTDVEECLCSNQTSVDQPMLATQSSKPKDLNREVNQSSKAAPGLRQESVVKNNQEQKQLPVKKVPGCIMEKNQCTGSVARSVSNFGRDSVKQDGFGAPWGGEEIGSPLDILRYKRFDQTHGHPQEAYLNLKGQSMHRWQQPKVWCCKVTGVQEQRLAATTCTFSGGKPVAENKKQVNFLQGTSCVSWRPKQMSSVQGSKEKCQERGKDHVLSSVSQKKRAQGECICTENCNIASLSARKENAQQLNKEASLKLTRQMKENSKVCLVVSCSNASSSPLCESRQQVEKLGNQGLMEPASQPEKAFEELSLSSCESGQQISDTNKQESPKHESQMKTGTEESSIVTSSSCATMSPPCRKAQQNGDTGKQSYKAVLEMEHSAIIQKVTSSVEQAVFGPMSQPVSVVAISLKSEDASLTRNVRPHRKYTSWRPKMASTGSSAIKSAISKEVNENDPLASTQLVGAQKKHINPSPASIFAASDDLHVWKNNGRHPIRASYGLPYRRKDHLQLQKPLDHQTKFHTDGSSSLELPNRAKTSCLDGESPMASKGTTSKEMKQIKLSPSQGHPVFKLKFSQHHVYPVKQAHFTSNQQVGNRRPFSMKSNFNDDKKLVHYQQSLSHMCSPMEQGYHKPFFGKPNFSYDDNKKAVHHQQFLSRGAKHREQAKIRENFYAWGSWHVESPSGNRSDIKPARLSQLHSGRKLADSDKKGWVVKTQARCEKG